MLSYDGSRVRESVTESDVSWVTAGFAPVGFHATKPLGSGHWHVGGMLSVIDLGALSAARFGSETEVTGSAATTAATTVSEAPKFDLANLVSPGVFVTLGIDNSPFVLGGGARVVPARKVETTTTVSDSTMMSTVTETSTKPAVQFLITFAVDVPILQF